MSEFTCMRGHLIRPSVGYCEECGSKPYRMDGMTNREIEARERAELDKEIEDLEEKE